MFQSGYQQSFGSYSFIEDDLLGVQGFESFLEPSSSIPSGREATHSEGGQSWPSESQSWPSEGQNRTGPYFGTTAGPYFTQSDSIQISISSEFSALAPYNLEGASEAPSSIYPTSSSSGAAPAHEGSFNIGNVSANNQQAELTFEDATKALPDPLDKVFTSQGRVGWEGRFNMLVKKAYPNNADIRTAADIPNMAGLCGPDGIICSMERKPTGGLRFIACNVCGRCECKDCPPGTCTCADCQSQGCDCVGHKCLKYQKPRKFEYNPTRTFAHHLFVQHYGYQLQSRYCGQKFSRPGDRKLHEETHHPNEYSDDHPRTRPSKKAADWRKLNSGKDKSMLCKPITPS